MKTTIFNKVSINDIKEVSVIAKRWFQKSYGDTYHSVELSVLVSGETANKIDPVKYPIVKESDVYIDLAYNGFEYGYGDHYNHTALQMLIATVTDAPEWLAISQSMYTIRTACNKLDVHFSETCIDVDRKKDL